MHILVAEDERRLAGLIRRALEEESHVVDVSHDGAEALQLAEATDYDLLVLDLMMPHLDGIEVCKRLRAGGKDTRILMLTARDAVEDRVEGLEAGADDYLVKPFSFAELLARVRALSRRQVSPSAEQELCTGDLVLDLDVELNERDARRPLRQGDVVAPAEARQGTHPF